MQKPAYFALIFAKNKRFLVKSEIYFRLKIEYLQLQEIEVNSSYEIASWAFVRKLGFIG